jgi:hypothetical protein
MSKYAVLEISLRRWDEESYEADLNYTQPDGETVISAENQACYVSRTG